MPPVAVALILASAVLHVTWNALVKSAGDPLRQAARGVWFGTLAATPVVAVAWLATGRPNLTPVGWALAGLSGVVEAAFWITLGLGYRRGELSTVYPVARGSAALLGALSGILVVGERPGPVATLGVVALLAGILVAVLPRLRAPGVTHALALGALIATYSTIDRLGVREGPAWLYGWALFAAGGVILAVAVRFGPRGTMAAARSAPPGERPTTALGAGVLMVGAYALILAALAVAPLAGVAPLRESSTVLAAAWGVIGLREREGALARITGAVLIAAGAVLLAAGG